MFETRRHKFRQGGPAPDGRRRVALVVEDDPSELEEVTRYLRDEHRFLVLSAYDYRGAVAQLESHEPPDVACIDLSLPRESGYELCEYIRHQPRFAFVPIIVMGEDSFPGDMAQAELVGANAFLEKPFQLSAMATYLQVLLDGPRRSGPGVRLLRLA